ncbi:MAG: OmpA family protein [Calditrichaceae bacterium]
MRKKKLIESPFSISISDLMAALLLLFMLLTMSLMYELSKTVEVKSRVYKLLDEKLKAAGLETDIDSRSGTISIADTILFESNRSYLKSGSKQFLNKLTPILAEVLCSEKEIADEIYAIDIEGYSSERGRKDQHMMDLSLDRAQSVWNYIYSLNRIPYRKQFLSKIKVCGWGNMRASHWRDLQKDRKVVFQLQFKGTMEKLESALAEKGFTKAR